MEDDSDYSETQPLYPRSSRQSCFVCRRCLEDRPLIKSALQFFLGTVQLLHFWAFLILLYLKIYYNQGSYSHCLIPLSTLIMELFLTCLVVIFIIFNDIFYRKIRGITLWQRQAIGRLIRNLFALFLIGFTCVALYHNLVHNDLELLKPLLPGIFLNAVIFLRFLLIVAEYSAFWLVTSLIVLVQQVLLIGKIDYNWDIDWEIVVLPAVVQSVWVVLMTGYMIYEKYGDYCQEILAILNFIGCVCISFASFYGVYVEIGLLFYLCLAVGFGLLSIGMIENLGSFLVDITIGHIDLDVLDLKHPVQSFSFAPHSV